MGVNDIYELSTAINNLWKNWGYYQIEEMTKIIIEKFI
jgi:hypothetical protein